MPNSIWDTLDELIRKRQPAAQPQRQPFSLGQPPIERNVQTFAGPTLEDLLARGREPVQNQVSPPLLPPPDNPPAPPVLSQPLTYDSPQAQIDPYSGGNGNLGLSGTPPLPAPNGRITLTPNDAITAPEYSTPQPNAPVYAPRSTQGGITYSRGMSDAITRGQQPTDYLLGRSPQQSERDRFDILTDPNNKVRNKGDIDPKTGMEKPAGFKGRLKDALLAALFTAGQQVRANGGVADWGTLGAGLAGGVGGAIRPQWNEELQRGRDIAQSQFRLGEYDRQNTAALGQQKILGDIQGQILSNQGKAISNQSALTELQKNQLVNDPEWQLVEKTQQITPEQAVYFNRKLGTNLKPGYWGGFKEDVDPATGKKIIRPVNDPRYSVNPTVNPDATVPPVNVNVNGIPISAKGSQVLGAVAAEAQANAQRQQGAITANANNAFKAQTDNAKAQNDYYQAVLGKRMELLKNVGAQVAESTGASGIAAEMQATAQQMQVVANQLAQIAPLLDPKGAEAAQKQLQILQERGDQLQKRFDETAGKFTGLQPVFEGLKNLNIPKPQTVTAPTIAPVQTQTITPQGGKILSKAAVQQAAKDNKISYSEAVRQAQAQGYTIQ